MTLDELRSRIANSTATDWYRIQGEATYHDRLNLNSGTGHTWLENTGHHATAVLRDHIAVTIAWALDFADREFTDLEYLAGIPWADKTTRHYVDVFVHGAVVERVAVDHVDGNYLPTPTPHFAPHELGSATRIVGWTVSTFEMHLANLVDELAGHSRADRVAKIGAATFVVTEDNRPPS